MDGQPAGGGSTEGLRVGPRRPPPVPEPRATAPSPGSRPPLGRAGRTFSTSSWFLRYRACFSSIHFMSLRAGRTRRVSTRQGQTAQPTLQSQPCRTRGSTGGLDARFRTTPVPGPLVGPRAGPRHAPTCPCSASALSRSSICACALCTSACSCSRVCGRRGETASFPREPGQARTTGTLRTVCPRTGSRRLCKDAPGGGRAPGLSRSELDGGRARDPPRGAAGDPPFRGGTAKGTWACRGPAGAPSGRRDRDRRLACSPPTAPASHAGALCLPWAP